MTSFAIVGIVGKSKVKPDDPRLADAESIGRAIAAAGHIVLSGGHVLGTDPSVKDRALIGAASAADASHAVRLIGILPGLPKGVGQPVATPWRSPDGLARGFFFATGLEAADRDLITGGAPDLVIALRGTGGTAKEVAAAIDAHRPVVYVDSFDTLAPLIAVELRRFPPPMPSMPTEPIVVLSAADAVGVALKLVRPAPIDPVARWTTTYPGLHAAYEDALRSLRA